jgi:hypothetical protein
MISDANNVLASDAIKADTACLGWQCLCSKDSHVVDVHLLAGGACLGTSARSGALAAACCVGWTASSLCALGRPCQAQCLGKSGPFTRPPPPLFHLPLDTSCCCSQGEIVCVCVCVFICVCLQTCTCVYVYVLVYTMLYYLCCCTHVSPSLSLLSVFARLNAPIASSFCKSPFKPRFSLKSSSLLFWLPLPQPPLAVDCIVNILVAL